MYLSYRDRQLVPERGLLQNVPASVATAQCPYAVDVRVGLRMRGISDGVLVQKPVTRYVVVDAYDLRRAGVVSKPAQFLGGNTAGEEELS
jgi:hypothetical protein